MGLNWTSNPPTAGIVLGKRYPAEDARSWLRAPGSSTQRATVFEAHWGLTQSAKLTFQQTFRRHSVAIKSATNKGLQPSPPHALARQLRHRLSDSSYLAMQ